VAPLDQTFADEASQRYADKRPADPEMCAELILAELGTWLERLLDDGAMQRLIRRIRTFGGPLHVRALRFDGASVPRSAIGGTIILCPRYRRLAYKIGKRNLNF
jgi:hypothetical protein